MEYREHVKVIHTLAKRANCKDKIPICCFGQNPKTGEELKEISRFSIGDVDGAVKYIEKHMNTEHLNIYMPVSTTDGTLFRELKGSERDVEKVLGIVIDLDDERACEYNDRLPLPVDMVLESSKGHFQCFYFFEKALTVKEAKPIAQALKAFAGADHCTSDVSHVWRIPGLKNWPNKSKVENGRPPEPQICTVKEEWDDTYTSLDELRGKLKDELEKEKPSALTEGLSKQQIKPDKVKKSISESGSKCKVIVGDLVLDRAAEPNVTMLEALMEVDPQFKMMWSGGTPEHLQDKSASSVDNSMVMRAIHSDWPDQEIANMVIALRRRLKRGPDKALRRDYIERTILSAKKKVAEKKTEDTSKLLSGFFGCKILSVNKYLLDDPEYLIRTDFGDVRVGSHSCFNNLSCLGSCFSRDIKKHIPENKKLWGKVKQALLDMSVDKEVSVEATLKHRVQSRLIHHLERHIGTKEADARSIHCRVKEEDLEVLIGDDGNLLLHFPPFWRNYDTYHNVMKGGDPRRKILMELRRNGCKGNVKRNVYEYSQHTGHTRKKISYWRIPQSYSGYDAKTDKWTELI
jgi:hypothetical protein